MSFQNVALPIQKTILNYANTGYVSNLLLAVLQAARLNNTITPENISVEAGKKRQFKINYVPPMCDTDGSCTDNICTPGQEVEPAQVFFNLSKCTASKVLSLSLGNTRLLENIGADEYSRVLVAQLLQGARESLANDVAALLAANVGCHLDGSETKTVQMVSPVNGSLNPLGKAIIDKTFLDAKISSNRPFMVGGSSVFYTQQAAGIAGQNFLGQNLGGVNFPNTFYDQKVNEAYGSGEHIWAFDPGVFKFIAFNENSGRFATDLREFRPETMYQQGPDWLHTTILDPVSGLIWDLDAMYDKCTKKWNFQIKLQWDIFFMPQNVCNIPCVNGIFHFLTCEILPVECPTVEPTTPVTPQTYAVTPTLTYPRYIAEVKIGNATYRPEVNVASVTEFVAMLNAQTGGGYTLVGGEIKYNGYSAQTILINGGAGNGGQTLTFALD